MRYSQPVIAVVGAGRMGIGIAHVFAYAGSRVLLIDAKERAKDEAHKVLNQASQQISGNLELFCSMGMLNEKAKGDILDRISYLEWERASETIPEADVLFEAVPEVIEIKEEIFGRICSIARADALIASTTSTFSVDLLADFVDLPERFMNTHWLNPAFLIPLVEVSPAERTNEINLENMLKLLKDVGKVPVKCSPSPGFIVPRIQALAMNEAARMYEEGVASAEEIDRAVRVGFGIRFAVLGLLEFIDWGGGDILYYASRYLKDSLGSERFSPPQIIVDNMEKGNIGMKTGKGFYDFTGKDTGKYQYEVITRFTELLRFMGMLPDPDCLNKSVESRN